MIGPKKKVGGIEVGKRIMLNDNHRNTSKKSKTNNKYSKLPAIASKNIIITGDLKISEMISNPC